MNVKNELTKRYKNKREIYFKDEFYCLNCKQGECTATFTRAIMQFGEHKSFNNIHSHIALFLSTAKNPCKAKANKFNLKYWIKN